MNADEQNAERLNAAVDGLLEGHSADALREALPESLHTALEVGASLAALGRFGGGLPRPGFLLSLEEQLRADLRLNPPGADPETPVRSDSEEPPSGQGDEPLSGHGDAAPTPQPGVGGLRAAPELAPAARSVRWAGFRLPWSALLAGGLALVGLLGVDQAARRAGPRDPLYGFKRGAESARLLAAWSAADRSAACLDAGWRRLAELRGELGLGSPADPLFIRLLDDLAASYTLALTYAEQAEDRRSVFLARAQAEAALAELRRLRPLASGPQATLLDQVNLLRAADGSGEGRIVALARTAALDPTDRGSRGGAARPIDATALAGAPATPTAEPPTATQSPPLQPSATTALPSPTLRPASATPPPSPVATEPTLEPPPPSATPLRPKRPDPTATEPPAPPTAEGPTREPWSTATPEPPATDPAPGPGARTPDPGPTQRPPSQPPAPSPDPPQPTPAGGP